MSFNSLSVMAEALAYGEIQTHFQPKVSLVGGRLCGVEALARWTSPQYGSVSPEAFIPAIQEVGLIGEFTRRVLQQACHAQRAWRDNGLVVPVSINLSPLLLENPSLADHCFEIVTHYGGSPGDIDFELTESSLMSDTETAEDQVLRLRLKGFGLTIDDFGTGYSSPEWLKNIAATELKLDRQFVHGVTQDPRKRSIVESCSQLAEKLSMVFVAKGCETRAEWDLLAATGCQQVQGWFAARAMSAEDLPGWLQSWRAPDGMRLLH